MGKKKRKSMTSDDQSQSSKSSKERKVPRSATKAARKHLREGDFDPSSAENSEDYIAFDFDDDADTKSESEKESSRKQKPSTTDTSNNNRRREDEQWKNYIKDRKPRPWAKDFRYRKARNIGERLNMEMNDLVDYLSPTEEEHTMRRFAVHRIRQCAQQIYPSCRIEVFGSFETRLYLPTSDIDLVMWYNGSDSVGSHGTSKVLSKMADGLRKQGIAYSVQLILKAKVPIIKFEETFTGYQIDISLNTGNGIQSAKFIKEMLVQAPALGPLTLIFKHWLGLQKLNEVFTGGLGSYAVVLMVMSCLQMHPQVDMSDTLDNLGVLFVDLLELYGQHFNIFTVGIDVANRRYYRKPDYRAVFAVKDPADETNDVSRGSFNCAQIRISLKDAFHTLTRAMTALNRQTWDYGAKDDGISLLGCILYIDKPAIEHRERVHDAYTSQQWKDMPGADTFDASDYDSSASVHEPIIKIHGKGGDILDKKGKRRDNKNVVYVLEDEDAEFRGQRNAWNSDDEDSNLSLPQLT